MIASVVSMPIFDIKYTGDKTNVSTTMFSESGKKLSFGSLDASVSPKISSGEFVNYSRTSGLGGFKFGSSTGESEFDTLPKIKTDFGLMTRSEERREPEMIISGS